MLDKHQQQIVSHRQGHALILAGAGSGKTTCAVNRVANLINSGLPPRYVLMLTFTNKACSEMRERLLHLIDGEAVGTPNILTFHKFGYRLLLRQPTRMGRNVAPSILNEAEPQRLLNNILKAEGFRAKHEQENWQMLYAWLVNEGVLLDTDKHISAIMDRWLGKNGWDSGTIEAALRGFRQYDIYKRNTNVVDFDDLILLPLKHLALPENQDLLLRLRGSLRDITVDEAQDNNMAQYMLLQLIAGETVVMIGDDDQSIYRWRGSRPDNLKRFVEEFGPAIYKLERNYRSPHSIVAPASQLIRHNTDRLEKNPHAFQAGGAPIALHLHRNEEHMAKAVVQQIQKAMNHGRTPGDFAVLYRTNAMARPLEAAFLQAGVPYEVRQGIDLLKRAEARMLVAAMRVAMNPADMPALTHLLGMLPGVGPKTLEKLHQAYAQDPLYARGMLPPKTQDAMDALHDSIEALRKKGPLDATDWALGDPLYSHWLEGYAEKTVREQYKKRGLSIEGNQKEFKTSVERVAQSRRDTLFYMETALQARRSSATGTPDEKDWENNPWGCAMDILIAPPDEDKDGAGRVILSTVHSAKGLQWPVVHIAGMSDGLMPHYREGDAPDEEALAEERCLAYVAITRGEREVILHHPRHLSSPGMNRNNLPPSRFIKEAGIAPVQSAGDPDHPRREALFRPPQWR